MQAAKCLVIVDSHSAVEREARNGPYNRREVMEMLIINLVLAIGTILLIIDSLNGELTFSSPVRMVFEFLSFLGLMIFTLYGQYMP